MKKIATLLIVITLVSILLTGCLNNNNEQGENDSDIFLIAPIPIIIAPENAHFGESIEFDGSESKDEDGKIQSYSWIFGDGERNNGVKVSHIYEFDNNFTREYPLIHQVVLEVIDNDDIPSFQIHYIGLYPQRYTFYLDKDKLDIEKPSSNKDKIRASFGKLRLNPLKELTYELPNSINVQPSTWNAIIYIEKPWLSMVTLLSLALYDNDGEKITEVESNFKLFKLWREKTIVINGKIDNAVEFKSLKLVIHGFSLREKINILYGGEKASFICFDFT